MTEKRIRRTREEVTTGLDISSLIDVSFLLLIYFLVTSTLDPREADLALTMPDPRAGASSTAPSPSIDPPLIRVDGVGNVSWNGELVDSGGEGDLPMLQDRLRTYLEAWKVMDEANLPRVELQVDDGVPAQRFVDVIDCLALVEITDVTLLDFRETE